MAMVGVEMILPMYLQNHSRQKCWSQVWHCCLGRFGLLLMSPVTGSSVWSHRGGKRFAQLGLFLLTIATLPYFFLTESTRPFYYGDLCCADVWDFNGHDAFDDEWDERLITWYDSDMGQQLTTLSVRWQLPWQLLSWFQFCQTSPIWPNRRPVCWKPIRCSINKTFGATLSGYHAAFCWQGFSLIGWILAFFLNTTRCRKKWRSKMKRRWRHDSMVLGSTVIGLYLSFYYDETLQFGAAR